MDNYMGSGACSERGTHEILVKLQWEDYKGELITTLTGNVFGASVLQCIAESLEAGNMSFKVCKENERFVVEFDESDLSHSTIIGVRLYDKNNNEMELDYESLSDIVTGIEIIEFQPED